MRLNQERVARYLDALKKLNDYLLKTSSKNREAMIIFAEARHHLLQGEKKFRDLLNIVAKEKIDG